MTLEKKLAVLERFYKMDSVIDELQKYSPIDSGLPPPGAMWPWRTQATRGTQW